MMKRKQTCLFLLVFFAMKGFSQEKYALISGKIISSNNSVGNVHIVNLNTKLGTVSNDNGEFEMMVSLNDILLFSSIEYEKKEIRMTDNFLKYKRIMVELIPKVNELAEVFIEGLTGNLKYDIKKVPIDTVRKHSFFLKPGDLKKVLPPDLHGAKKAPYVGFFPPIPGSVPLPDARYEAEQRLKREISKKKNNSPQKSGNNWDWLILQTNCIFQKKKSTTFWPTVKTEILLPHFTKTIYWRSFKFCGKKALHTMPIKINIFM